MDNLNPPMPEAFKFFGGECLGAVIKRRASDNHAVIQICVEDDGLWHRRDVEFSSHWLDDLIRQLQLVKKDLEQSHKKEPHGFGYSFLPTEDNYHGGP